MTKIRTELEILNSLGAKDEGNFSLIKYLDKKGERNFSQSTYVNSQNKFHSIDIY